MFDIDPDGVEELAGTGTEAETRDNIVQIT
jgi:hypothetical protein